MKKNVWIKAVLVLLSNILIGVGVGFMRIACLGTDPYSCFGLGIANFLRKGCHWNFMTFGLCLALLNALLLIVIFITMKHRIGFGTICNMLLVGVSADGANYVLSILLGTELGIIARIVTYLIGFLLVGGAAGFYMAGEMGMSAYDALGYISEELMEKKGKKGLSYRWCRIICDFVCVVVGIAFGSTVGVIWEIAGVGTALMVFGAGPLIQAVCDGPGKKVFSKLS